MSGRSMALHVFVDDVDAVLCEGACGGRRVARRTSRSSVWRARRLIKDASATTGTSPARSARSPWDTHCEP